MTKELAIIILGSFLGSLISNLIHRWWDHMHDEEEPQADPDAGITTRYDDETNYLTPDKRYFTNKTFSAEEEDDEEHINRRRR